MNGALSWLLVLGLPLGALSLTSFVKISTVLAMVRASLGAPEVPSTTILMALSLALSGLVMAPVLDESARNLSRSTPVSGDDAGELVRYVEAAREPLRAFLVRTTLPWVSRRFERLAAERTPPGAPALAADDYRVLAPAFLASELTRAFAMGLALMLPFLLVDLVVSQVLMLLGLTGLSTASVSTPLKILLFLSVDGWPQLSQLLLASYAHG